MVIKQEKTLDLQELYEVRDLLIARKQKTLIQIKELNSELNDLNNALRKIDDTLDYILDSQGFNESHSIIQHPSIISQEGNVLNVDFTNKQ